MGTLAHEVMHPALQHHTRRNGRDPRRWNMACDYAINPILVDAGLTLPEGVLLEDRFRGMSAERIYNQLEEEEQSQQSSNDQDSQDSDSPASGQDDQSSNGGAGDEDDDVPSTPKTPGGIGQVLDAPEPVADGEETVAEQARDWQMAVEQAENVARLAGKMPAGAQRSVEASTGANVGRGGHSAAWRRPRRRTGTGVSCCVAHGQKRFRPTIAGPAPTVATSGQVFT